MKKIENQTFTMERALFESDDLLVQSCVFKEDESPLKESRNIKVLSSSFEWKYPLWYCENVEVSKSIWSEDARSGVWYTNNILVDNCTINAPKNFRRAHHVVIKNSTLPSGLETLWNCSDITLENVKISGDYLAFNSENIVVENLTLLGNYAFDGCKNIVIKNSHLESKDAFWNCENVVLENCVVNGEYFGWNSQNVTLINCTISSLQGFCYMENLVMRDCRLGESSRVFEFSSVDAEIIGHIESIDHPLSGKIVADSFGECVNIPEEVEVLVRE